MKSVIITVPFISPSFPVFPLKILLKAVFLSFFSFYKEAHPLPIYTSFKFELALFFSPMPSKMLSIDSLYINNEEENASNHHQINHKWHKQQKEECAYLLDSDTNNNNNNTDKSNRSVEDSHYVSILVSPFASRRSSTTSTNTITTEEEAENRTPENENFNLHNNNESENKEEEEGEEVEGLLDMETDASNGHKHRQHLLSRISALLVYPVMALFLFLSSALQQARTHIETGASFAVNYRVPNYVKCSILLVVIMTTFIVMFFVYIVPNINQLDVKL